MIEHLALDNDPEKRKQHLSKLIRSGAIRFGGYKKARIYGLLSCASGKRIKVENMVFFKDEKEAIAAGYRPCGHCLRKAYQLWKMDQ